jgi:hypothetical protein
MNHIAAVTVPVIGAWLWQLDSRESPYRSPALEVMLRRGGERCRE